MLECLQKSLRIANSATEEIVTVQLYCDALDQYLFYLDHKASAVSLTVPVDAFSANESVPLGDPEIR